LNKEKSMKEFKQYNKDYVDYFLSLKCCGDILNIVSPIQNAKKEISESIAIINKIRHLAIQNPMEYTLIDLCAGNALTSVISSFLLPFKQVFAIDKRSPKRDWKSVKRFQYIGGWNLLEKDNFPGIIGLYPPIFISVHPCRELAIRTIEIAKIYNAPLFLMPCCIGQIENEFNKKVPFSFIKKLSKYERWCWFLADMTDGKLTFDKKVISPCNGIIETYS